MKKSILFVCHGNICRSPMAEYTMKYLVKQKGLQDDITVSSKATSDEAIGCNIYSQARRVLERHKIPYDKHIATRLTENDYAIYDYIVVMDNMNYYNALKIFGGEDKENKVKKMLQFCNSDAEVPDPWYTGNFEEAWSLINEGCKALLDKSEA